MLQLDVPGSNEWAEEEWERLAAAVGATLVPAPEPRQVEDSAPPEEKTMIRPLIALNLCVAVAMAFSYQWALNLMGYVACGLFSVVGVLLLATWADDNLPLGKG